MAVSGASSRGGAAEDRRFVTPTTLAVAVCVDVDTPFLARCVQALQAQGIDPEVRTAGTPASMRNAALAQCDSEVLAFVDPDVVVPEGWLTALRTGWDDAPSDRGVIGGALGLRFETDRPQWLADGLLTALGPYTTGATLPSGNVSFRAAALRGVGGFWPARGEPGQRDLFTEAHLVQHELHAAGWTGELRPELAAVRLVGDVRRRDVLRFRARYGARNQRIGEPRNDALGGLISSAVGAVAAGWRADLAMERAGRAAEALGNLASARFAHDALQPVETSTPFAPCVPDPQPAKRRAGRRAGERAGRRESPAARGPDGALVLLYHRIADPSHDPLGLCVSPRNFGEQMDVLRLRAVALDALRPGAVAVTFDDGYADNVLEAAPRLQGVPATFFISTGHVEEGWSFWWDTLDRLVSDAPASAGPLEIEDRAWIAQTPVQREIARRHLHAMLQVRSRAEIEPALRAVAQWSGAAGRDPAAMTISQLRDLASIEGVDIGAHSRTHRSLRWAPEEARADELSRSRNDLTSWLGTAPRAFSYPYGVPARDVDIACERAVREAGFQRAVVNGGGAAQIGGDPFAIPRVVAPDLAGDAFAEWVDAQLRR